MGKKCGNSVGWGHNNMEFHGCGNSITTSGILYPQQGYKIFLEKPKDNDCKSISSFCQCLPCFNETIQKSNFK